MRNTSTTGAQRWIAPERGRCATSTPCVKRSGRCGLSRDSAPHGIRVLEGNGFALTYLPDTAPRFIQRQQPERLRYVTWFDPESGRFSAAAENTAPQFTAISPWDHDSVLIFSEEPLG